ncbi:hypothetical protein [Longimonas halophila]|uniref:hypothetical protein n=1 Tax=Longimonas halophila TaxID=1469170 RepID=UPI001142C3BF|nr:hypothetical protein [Longimonas halophila]
MPALRLLIYVAVCVLLVGGCGGDVSPSSADANRPAPTVAKVDLVIGVAEGEAPYMFGRIGGVVADAQNRMIVTDTQGDVVRAYDADGTYLFDVATAGEGPGEVDTPCCPAVGPEGALWIRDDQNRRYLRFRVDAEGAMPDGQIRMSHQAFGRAARTTFDANGYLIDVGNAQHNGGVRTMRFHRSIGNETMHEQPIPEAPGGRLSVQEVDIEGGKVFIPQPFGSRALDAHAPNSDWAFAITDRYEVIRYNADGDTLHVIEHDVDGPALSDDERERARRSLQRYTDTYGVATSELAFGVPDRKPPIDRIFFDAQSHLWVQRSMPDNTPNEADVYDTEGALVKIVQWPNGVALHQGYLLDDTLYGTQTTEDGVPQVVRLQM